VSKDKRRVSREIGVEIGAICSKYFLKSQHLHYGYWTSGLEVDIANLRIAQENYAKFLISHIPEGVSRILDVGCGSGQTAKILLDLGYQVDCVSPNPYLSKEARQLLGAKSHIFECFYEELETENRYDLIFFSESFQYIDPEEAIGKTFGLLNEGGYVLICDIFKKDTPGKSPLPGGHPLRKFYDIISEYSLEPVEDLDITEQTSPTLDVANDMLKEVIQPTVDLTQQLLNDRYPFMSKVLKFLYRKRISKISKKYFSGVKTGENFRKFKSYRLLLYRKRSLANVWQLDFTGSYLDAVGSESAAKVKISTITTLANSKRFDRILNYLRKRRTLVLKLAFLVLIAEDILTGKKPHELNPFEHPSGMAIIGLILVIAGATIRFLVPGHFVKGRLFTTGPYSIVRHPLYLGLFLIVIGVLFQLNDWINWAIILPLFTLFYGAAIIYEERALSKRFGREWEIYRAKVPAVIPSLRNWPIPRPSVKWSWRMYLTTPEVKATLWLLTLPLWIEMIEDLVFERMLGI